MSPFLRDYLRAVLLFGAFLVWTFHVPLSSGRVASFSDELPVGQAILSMNEQLYQIQPVIYTTARMLRRGQWPSWTPLAQAGTPLIGKMMNGTFSPLHLPFYLLPSSFLPRLFMVVLALQALAGFSFAYLYARAIELRFWPAFLAGILFIFGYRMFAEGLYATWPSSIFLPLLLLLVEVFLRGRRTTALWLAPWAAALPFLAGHFESALRCDAVAAAYFLVRLRLAPRTQPPEKLGSAAMFLGACAVGAALAACQILPGFEYVRHSYNQVWRTLPEFGWFYHTIGKRLYAEDAALLIAGWGGLGAGLWFLRKLASEEGPVGAADALRALLAAAGLAAAISCLSWIGLDDGTQSSYLSGPSADWPTRLSALLLLALSFWAWTRREAPPGVRSLGFVLAGSLIVLWKTPPFANILLHFPGFGLFNNTVYAPECALAVAVLGAAGFQRWHELSRQPFAPRAASALRLSILVAVCAAGYGAAQPLKGFVVRNAETGTDPAQTTGAFMGPESFSTRDRRQAFSGWLASSADLEGVTVGLGKDGRIAASVEASLGPARAGRRRFDAELTLPEKGVFQVFAQARRGPKPQWLNGPKLEAVSSPLPLALGFILAAVCLLVCLPWTSIAAGILILGLCAVTLPVRTRPASEVPFRLPGIEALKADAALFRLASLRDNFLQADYANIYEAADIRNGGDNLDVLPLVHFVFFSYSLLNQPAAAAHDLALRLLGLANVRYLLDVPGAAPVAPALEPVYRGDDMTVFRNRYALPRAVFFDGYAELPLHRLEDWRARGRNYSAIMEFLARTKLDPSKTLLLHDAPSPAVAQSAGTGAGGRVSVEEYLPDRVRLAVEASRPGLVLLSDNSFPGWRALRDGSPTKILRSWFTFRAVEVPAGRSIVEFIYRPGPLIIGTGVSIFFALAWAWLYLGRRFQAAAPPVPPVKKKNKNKELPASPPSLELEGSSNIAEAWTVGLVGSGLLFWGLWGGLVYCSGLARTLPALSEGWPVNAASCAAVAALAWRAVSTFRRDRP